MHDPAKVAPLPAVSSPRPPSGNATPTSPTSPGSLKGIELALHDGLRTQVPWHVFWRHKYKPLIETIPIVLLAVLVRLLLEYAGPGAPFNTTGGGYIVIGDITSVLSGGIFLVGFMLNGVIADYKESEKLPGEIAVCLAGLEDALTWAVAPKQAKGDELFHSPARVRAMLLRLTNVIFKWLATPCGQRVDDPVHTALSKIWSDFGGNSQATAFVSRLRIAIVRVSVISSSTYLPAGSAVVEAFCCLAMSLVVICKYTSQAAAYGVIIGTSILYGGMLRLLRDVDDPFQYEPIPDHVVVHSQSGSTEIDLAVLLDYRRLLCERIVSDPAGQALLKRPVRRRTNSDTTPKVVDALVDME